MKRNEIANIQIGIEILAEEIDILKVRSLDVSLDRIVVPHRGSH